MSLDDLRLHLGSWQGWFRDYDAEGRFLGQKASEITFRELAPHTYEQVNRYGSQSQRWVYTSLAAGLRFFPEGSFSNGQIQLAPFSGFAVEQGFLWQDHKARLVQQWDPQGQVSQFTTILEDRDPGSPREVRDWQGQGLEGSWTGTSITYGADSWHPESGSALIPDLLAWWQAYTPNPRIRYFPGQMVAVYPPALPMPTQHRHREFAVQLGWLPQPDHYCHLIRRYNREGTWQDVTLWHLTKT